MTQTKVIVGLGSCGIAAGAGRVYSRIKELKEAEQLSFELAKTSCIGMCFREPLVEVVDGNGSMIYGEVDEQRATEIIRQHVVGQRPIREYVVKTDQFSTPDSVFFDGQVKIALRNCGYIDPENIQEYEARGGYSALRRITGEGVPPEAVIQTVTDSGLRGRGGGGFPTGAKWRFARAGQSVEKYIICNADEGDPGAFMDRSLLEGDPHAVIEGMIIGAYAIGATEGVIYCRAEYPLAIRRLSIALEQAHGRGYLGSNILGVAGFNLHIHIKEGAGAFVCGEETALMASIEGKRGMPSKRPPFPAESGLWQKSSNINNVETLASVPYIVGRGADQFNRYGTEKSKGTKVFALTGKVKHGGLVEVPMGMSLRNIIFTLGGGIQNNRRFKAVQLGGPSGGCIPEQLIDIPVDYDEVNATGAIMGSGGMVVMDETTCMVDVARFFLDFTQKESCGKCTFCRIGTKRMLEILTRITTGNGQAGDIEKLEELALQVRESSLCGLGQTAPNPVLTTIKYFRHEYEAHIHNRRCPAHSCAGLLTYEIVPDRCTGCTVCAVKCPVKAIDGERKKVHRINQNTCIKCGDCFAGCRFDAITKS